MIVPVKAGVRRADDEDLHMQPWPLNACADVIDAAAACATALDTTPAETLRFCFLEDALVLLVEAEDLLVDHRRPEAVDALFAALSLLSDAIDAAEALRHDDPAAEALDLATHAVAAATAF